MMTETSLYREIEYYTWKIHKEQQHLKFLDNCKKEDILQLQYKGSGCCLSQGNKMESTLVLQ